MDNNINIELILTSARVRLKQLGDFSAGMKIKNNSSHDLGFDVSKTELLVNDKKNIAWDLAVQNGTLINLIIPATTSKEVKWPLGNALFPVSGKYKLELKWKNTSQIREVTVFDL